MWVSLRVREAISEDRGPSVVRPARHLVEFLDPDRDPGERQVLPRRDPPIDVSRLGTRLVRRQKGERVEHTVAEGDSLEGGLDHIDSRSAAGSDGGRGLDRGLTGFQFHVLRR